MNIKNGEKLMIKSNRVIAYITWIDFIVCTVSVRTMSRDLCYAEMQQKKLCIKYFIKQSKGLKV